MGLYENIKDIANLVQKADNIDLYKQLLDLGAQALELQKELIDLQSENKSLKERLNARNEIIRHKGCNYITLKDDLEEIHYCPVCFGESEKLIQLNESDICYICYTRGH